MSTQLSLLSPASLAASVLIPKAPALIPHTDWPYPGMTPTTSAQAAAAGSAEYHEMLAAVIASTGGDKLTTKQVLALVPQDWRELCGKYVHATLPSWTAKEHGIKIDYVPHDDGGFHFAYQAKEKGIAL